MDILPTTPASRPAGSADYSQSMIDIWDAEGAQRAIYESGGCDPAEAVTAHELARACMGRGWCEYLQTIAGGVAGMYSPHGVRERIYLRRGLTPHREAWTIFHELAERYCYADRGDEQHEHACDRIAARLRAPRGAFMRLVADLGRDLGELARESGQSQTSTALRLGEVFREPVAVVTPSAVHLRGDEWGWPDESELRRLTRARHLPPQLRRVKIEDARGRYALLAA